MKYSSQRWQGKATAYSDWELSPATVQAIEAPDVLLIALGIEEVFKDQLDMAKTLIGVRVRVATFNCNRSLVLDRGLEFYDIDSTTVPPARRCLAEMWHSACVRLSWAFFGHGHAQVRGSPARPFVAEIAIRDQSSKLLMHRSYRISQTSQMLLKPVSHPKGRDLEANVEISDIAQNLKVTRRGSNCTVFRALTAQWRHPQSGLNLSGAAAAGLISSETIRWSELELLPSPWQRIHYGGLQAIPAVRRALLDHLYAFVLLVSQILDQMLQTIGQRQFAEENSRCLRMRDPLRQSRMRQAWFDLELIKRHADGDVEDYISQLWEERRRCLMAMQWTRIGEVDVDEEAMSQV
ncbi:hypothetical protein M409DRAFT_20396 [Zasmidium cellare ATCC 36951]|uniref:Uncharacterized protein n=1 Tax=Zasmidium cellare ATCC 36951 TaxID=1080233 RepID=A0A6A6CTL2_ZASCE|nr:uncharacterized protein M409DRAFT_20396 [Zasmidium cellare ATCC 36951]KAF2169172.1 hypothetical protein M409DRAFT_20396 [Zasmidium cellare ATCC 36951]